MLVVTCTSCGRTHRARVELAGKHAKCPCGNRIQIPLQATEAVHAAEAVGSPVAAATAAVSTVQDLPVVEVQVGGKDHSAPGDEPDSTREKLDLPDWDGVRLAVRLSIVSHGLYLSGIVFLLFLFMVQLTRDSSSSRTSNTTFPTILTVLGGLQIFAAWILSALSGCSWIQAPPRHNARGLAAAMLMMSALGLIALPVAAGSMVATLERVSRRQEEFMMTSVGFIALYEMIRLTMLAWLIRSLAGQLADVKLQNNGKLLGILTPSCFLGVVTLTVFVVIALTPGPLTGFMLMALNIGTQLAILALGLSLLIRFKLKLDART